MVSDIKMGAMEGYACRPMVVICDFDQYGLTDIHY